MKISELFEEERRINGLTRKQAENAVKVYDDHHAEMSKSVSKKITAAERKLHDAIAAEEDRLSKMTSKAIQAETGEKPSKKAMSKEWQISAALKNKFGQEDFNTYLRVQTTDFHGQGRTEWNQQQSEINARDALRQFKELGEGQLLEMAKRATMDDFYKAAVKKYGAAAVKDIKWADVVALARELDVTIPAAAHKNKTGRGRVNLVPDGRKEEPAKVEPKKDPGWVKPPAKKEEPKAASKGPSEDDFKSALSDVKSAMKNSPEARGGGISWQGPERNEYRWEGKDQSYWNLSARYWGDWQGDDGSGDYDFQNISRKSSAAMSKIIADANKTWNKKGVNLDWQTSEKNWLEVSARAKK